MNRKVHCVRLDREEIGFQVAPYPGDLGKKIYDSVSVSAWQDWLKHQTMLINEYRLVPIEPQARRFLEGEMEKFFFGDGSKTPGDYVPPD